MSTLKMSKAQVLAEIDRDFAKYDVHGDGALNRDEITAILVKLQGSAPAGEIVGMLRFYNGSAREDGTVSKSEFTRW
jgi:Ca2+-binding EF-hand superfamily protein